MVNYRVTSPLILTPSVDVNASMGIIGHAWNIGPYTIQYLHAFLAGNATNKVSAYQTVDHFVCYMRSAIESATSIQILSIEIHFLVCFWIVLKRCYILKG